MRFFAQADLDTGYGYQTEQGAYIDGKPQLAEYSIAENQLRAAIVERRNLLALEEYNSENDKSNKFSPNSSVRSIKATFELHQPDAKRKARIGELDTLIEKLKGQLDTDGFSVDDNGMITGGSVEYVLYDHDPRLRTLTRLHIAGGRCFSDSSFRTPYDTTEMYINSGKGGAIYVMTASGNIHVSSQLKGYRHHSSLLAGRDVSCAGEMEINNGVITFISNQSGHYVPSTLHLYQVVHQLKRKGVALTFKVDDYSNDAGMNQGWYSNANEFLDRCRFHYEQSRLLTYLGAATPDLLRTLGWVFVGPNSSDKKAFGVYERTTGQRLPYKQVVTTLKGHGVNPKVYVGNK